MGWEAVTLDELLQAAGLAGGGTSPDATVSPRGFRPPTPSLGTGTDPMTGYPRAVGGGVMEPAVEPPLRLPGPGGMPDRPGGSSFWERLGQAGGLPAIPYRTGEGPGDNDRSSPFALLYNLAAGYANARGKMAGADKLERLTFADRQDQQVAARKAERDQTFARARTLAETVRKEKAEREAKRVDQMTTARRDHENRLQAWLLQINSPNVTEESLAYSKRMANREQQAIDTIDRDLSRLSGQQALQQAGVPDNEIPGLPTSAPKPPRDTATTSMTDEERRKADAMITSIAEGRMDPATIRSLTPRSNVRNYVTLGLADLGIDVRSIERDVTAEKVHTRTINGRQFTMLRGAEESIDGILKRLEAANAEVSRVAPITVSEDLNKFTDWFNRQGLTGGAAYDAINNRTTIASETRDQIAQVLQAGGTPTDAAMSIANEIVASDRFVPPRKLAQQIKSARVGFGIRTEAFKQSKPAYTKPGARPDPKVAPERPSIDSLLEPD